MQHTLDVQIFVGTIFRGLNFCGDKFSWVVVAHENLTPTKNYLLYTRPERSGVRKMLSIKRRSVTRRLASAIAAEGILDDSKLLESGRPLSGRRYLRSAIVEVQARVHTVIP